MKKTEKILKKTGNILITKKQSENLNNSVNEVLKLPEDHHLTMYLQKNKIPIPEYVMLMQVMGMLAIKEINPSTLTVFWLFLCKLQYGNHIGMNQLTIAEETGLSLVTVEKSIKQLREKNMILDYPDLQDKRRNIYIINPNVAWKGTAKQRIKTMRLMTEKNKNQLVLPFIKEDSEDKKYTNFNTNPNTKKSDD